MLSGAGEKVREGERLRAEIADTEPAGKTGGVEENAARAGKFHSSMMTLGRK
jgi:hypothetical protein